MPLGETHISRKAPSPPSTHPAPHAPPTTPTIDRRAIGKLVAALPSLGIDPEVVCRETGFDVGRADDEARVPLALLHTMWEAVSARSSRRDLALRVAANYAPGDYALLGFVAMSRPTLGEGLRQAERYMGLWADDPGLHLLPDGRLRVGYRRVLVGRPGRDRATEATLAEVLQAARHLTAERVTPREVRFQHAPPSEPCERASFAEFFGAPVRFGQPETELCFRAADLELALPQVDPQLGAFLQSLAAGALESRVAGCSPLESIREVIAEELQRGVPTINTVARRMGMSERTLRRRLEAERTTFREVIDRTRAELGRRYVGERRLALSEVAFLLGFSEPSAFHRAFKRWTDYTPGAWRRRAGGVALEGAAATGRSR